MIISGKLFGEFSCKNF